ncbi:MAG TPA: hypothetical protein PK567_02080 [Bacillota bacterium]|nr:hypothetical protein [Bacillota bacterium]
MKRKAGLSSLILILCLMVVLFSLPGMALAADANSVQIGDTTIPLDANASVSIGGGTVSYDLASKVLTLDNVNVTQETINTPALVANGDLTLNLVGVNTLRGANMTSTGYGMHVLGELTIQGSGQLTVIAGEYNSEDDGSNTGLKVDGNFSISSGTLLIECSASTKDSNGLVVGGDINVSGTGKVSAITGTVAKQATGTCLPNSTSITVSGQGEFYTKASFCTTLKEYGPCYGFFANANNPNAITIADEGSFTAICETPKVQGFGVLAVEGTISVSGSGTYSAICRNSEHNDATNANYAEVRGGTFSSFSDTALNTSTGLATRNTSTVFGGNFIVQAMSAKNASNGITNSSIFSATSDTLLKIEGGNVLITCDNTTSE